jgi:predicted dienelactone hydrolase
VLFAHGHEGEPADYAAVVTSWASRGYVVVAPEFPLSSRHALGGASFADLLEQPGDLSFVLTRVLERNADPRSFLHGLIDARRIGAVGHSMGAWTVLGMVANACCHDRRVTAAIILAGELAPEFRTKFFTAGAPPILFVHSRDDDVVPYAAGARAYAAAPRPKYLLRLTSGGHIVPYFGPKTAAGAAVLRVTNEFLDRYLRSIAAVAIVSPDPRIAQLDKRL